MRTGTLPSWIPQNPSHYFSLRLFCSQVARNSKQSVLSKKRMRWLTWVEVPGTELASDCDMGWVRVSSSSQLLLEPAAFSNRLATHCGTMVVAGSDSRSCSCQLSPIFGKSRQGNWFYQKQTGRLKGRRNGLKEWKQLLWKHWLFRAARVYEHFCALFDNEGQGSVTLWGKVLLFSSLLKVVLGTLIAHRWVTMPVTERCGIVSGLKRALCACFISLCYYFTLFAIGSYFFPTGRLTLREDLCLSILRRPRKCWNKCLQEE